LLESPELYDQSIEAAKEFAVQSMDRQPTGEQFANYLRVQHPDLLEADVPVQKLFVIAEALGNLIESRRDTIWAFVLKNIYKPLFLKGNFDFVVGNPPWLSFRYAEPEYQQFLKKQITETYRLLSGSGKNITNLELATLFLLRAADLYLKDGAIIAFVLPRSVFSADQHNDLRQGEFKRVGLHFEEAWDLEGVEPLFNVPACVLFAQKEHGAKVTYPIPGQVLRGKLPWKNAMLDEAEESLAVAEERFYLSQVGERSFWSPGPGIETREASPYKESFRRGADLYPRALWFVKVKSSPLGFDPALPPLESAEWTEEYAKSRWRGLMLRGNVESRFLYATLLSADLLPFGHLDYRLVVTPLEPSGEGHALITAEQARERGFFHLAQWIEKAQGEWERRRGGKAEKMSLFERLDYQHDLTLQNPQAKYRVLYPASATYLCACVVENQPIEFDISGQKVQAVGFLVDIKAYHFETNDRTEAFYLTAALNAPLVDKLLKPMQSRGQFGPRDIHKKVLELPIPWFDSSEETHLKLAELGRACTQKVADWLEAGGPGRVRSIGKLRSTVREMLAEELEEIDRLVRKMMEEYK